MSDNAAIDPLATSQRIRGVLAPVVTPFKPDLSPDRERFIRHCQWLLSQNCGLAPFGTTSEANSMSTNERISLLDALVAARIDPSRMMPGTGCCSISETVELTAHAVKHGCAGVLMLPPFYYKDVSEEGLYRYFSEVVQRVGDARLRIYLYHIPPVAIVGITPKLVERLLKAYPNAIAGMKDSSGDWNNTKTFLDAFAESARPVATRRGSSDCVRRVCRQRIVPSRKYAQWRCGHDFRDGKRESGSDSRVVHCSPEIVRAVSADVDLEPLAGAVKRRARRFQQQEISVDDRGVETGDCDLRERSGMGQGAAPAGRTHDRAGEIACRGIETDRLRDERNQERLIRNRGNWISEIGGKAEEASEF